MLTFKIPGETEVDDDDNRGGIPVFDPDALFKLEKVKSELTEETRLFSGKPWLLAAEKSGGAAAAETVLGMVLNIPFVTILGPFDNKRLLVVAAVGRVTLDVGTRTGWKTWPELVREGVMLIVPVKPVWAVKLVFDLLISWDWRAESCSFIFCIPWMLPWVWNCLYSWTRREMEPSGRDCWLPNSCVKEEEDDRELPLVLMPLGLLLLVLPIWIGVAREFGSAGVLLGITAGFTSGNTVPVPDMTVLLATDCCDCWGVTVRWTPMFEWDRMLGIWVCGCFSPADMPTFSSSALGFLRGVGNSGSFRGLLPELE